MIRVALLTFFAVGALLVTLALLNRNANSTESAPSPSRVTAKRPAAEQTQEEASCNTCPLPSN